MATRLAAAAALAVALLAAAGPVGAALSAPTPTSPANGSILDSLPTFGWNGVVGADHYEFQIAADPAFASPVLGSGYDDFATRNTRATLKKTVPNGTYWWHVRAVTKSGAVSAWSPGWSINKEWTSAPVPQSPVDGVDVPYPATPLTLTWSPVPRAATYLLSIATDPLLGSLVTQLSGRPVETSALAFTPLFALAPGTYYWGVTPVDAEGNRGTPSSVASFTWVWPSTTTTRFTDLSSASEVVDPQFSWARIPGAARYEVEVNPSIDFAPGSKVCCTDRTTGTSLSPVRLLPNNTYYWRVRAWDVDGNAGVWNTGPSFVKTFDTVMPSIQSLHMRDNLADPGVDYAPDTSDPTTLGYETQVPIVVWNPVPGAAGYEVNVAPYDSTGCDWNASDHSQVWNSKVATPAWTPLGWGYRAPPPYGSTTVANDNGKTLKVGSRYCVRARAFTDLDASNNPVYGAYTQLRSAGTLATGGSGPLRDWAFQYEDVPTAQHCTANPVPGDLPCTGYASAGDYVLPQSGAVSARTPLFTWTPVGTADGSTPARYFVIVAKDPQFTKIADYAFTTIPAYAPRTATAPTTYSDETTHYYWVVLPAKNADGSGSVGFPTDGAPQPFDKRSLPPNLLAPDSGAIITGQPTFRWTAAEGARRYRLQVSQDPSFGTLLDDVVTDSTAFTSSTTYPADSALYWRVRADDQNLIGLAWSVVGVFQKQLSTPVPRSSNPTTGDLIPTLAWSNVPGAVSYDFHAEQPDGTTKDFIGLRSSAATPTKWTGTGIWHWRVRANFPKAFFGVVAGPWSTPVEFTRTVHSPTSPATEVLAAHRLVFSWSPKVGVKNYRVQASTRADFATTVETVTTDNTSYAPVMTQTSYVNGGTLYWRVAAVDADGNVGDYTTAQTFTLPLFLRLSASGYPVKGKTVSITITATNPSLLPVRSAMIVMRGAGVGTLVHYTGSTGKTTFASVHATRYGTVTVTGSKSGYQTTSIYLTVH